MNLISRLNTHLSHSAHAWRDSMHLPWASSQEGSFTPSGSLVVAVALASVAAALVMVTA